MKTWLLVGTQPEFYTAIKQLEVAPPCLEVDSSTKILELLQQREYAGIDCIVLGQHVDSNLRLAQSINNDYPDVLIAILCDQTEYTKLQQLMQHSFMPTQYIKFYPISDCYVIVKDLLNRVHDRVLKRQHQAQLEIVNEQLKGVTFPLNSQGYLDTLLQHAPIGICICSLDWMIESWNKAAVKITKIHPAEAINRRLDTILPEIDAEFLKQLAQTTESQPLLLCSSIAGRLCWLELSATLIPDATQRMLLLFSDVTQKIDSINTINEAQNRLVFLADLGYILMQSANYQEMLERLAEVVVPRLADWCVVDKVNADNTLERVAVAADQAKLLGPLIKLRDIFPLTWDSPQPNAEALRKRTTILLEKPNLQQRTYSPEHLEIISQLNPVYVLALPLLMGDHLLGSISLVRMDEQRPYTLADRNLAQEVANRTAVVLENAYLYERAQQAIKLRDDFLSIAAHELKTPLTAMLGSTQLIQRYLKQIADPPERLVRRMNVIDGQVRRLSRLVTTLLDLSHVQHGDLQLEIESVDLVDLVTAIVDELRPLVSQHEFILHGFEEPCVLQIDSLRIEQVVQNIINNAIKYSPDATIIDITLECNEQAVRLSVRDYGLGIPEADLEGIWQRYYRAQNALGSATKGMGIGLSVVRDILELHGGSAEIFSTIDDGTTVLLTLPR